MKKGELSRRLKEDHQITMGSRASLALAREILQGIYKKGMGSVIKEQARGDLLILIKRGFW